MRKANSNIRFFCKIAIALLVLLCNTAILQAQDTGNWKDKAITLRVSNKPLGKVLEMVADAAGAKITLQGVSLWNINKATSLAVKDKPLDKVLDDLIGDQNIKIRYEGDNQIIVEPDAKDGAGESPILFITLPF